MKVYLSTPNEGWIIDHLGQDLKDFSKNSDFQIVNTPEEADIIWKMYTGDYRDYGKPTITTVHHIYREKAEDWKYKRLAKHTTVFHVFNYQTKIALQMILGKHEKPIHYIDYWVNPKRTNEDYRENYDIDSFIESEKETRFPEVNFWIGSFQRDTEGHDLISPKLEKGPDLFVDWVEYYIKAHLDKTIGVLLTDWRRQYITGELHKRNIPTLRIDNITSQQDMIGMYKACDLYLVASRCEGGPQAIIECLETATPIMSRSVGISEVLLPPNLISDNFSTYIPDLSDLLPAIEKLKGLYIHKQIRYYVSLFNHVKNTYTGR